VRIGLIVDGLGEVQALRHVLRRIQSPQEILITPLKAEIQPKARLTQITHAATEACEILARKRVDLAVVLMDLEDRSECPGAVAQQIQTLITERVTRIGLGMEVAVVLKVRQLENWLVSDLQCLRATPRLFPEVQRTTRSVPAGNADGVDGLSILKHAAGRRRAYDKVQDAIAICEHLDPGRAALNSRSFRRFLRVLGDSRYADQSRLPNHGP
jgi:hypothetical protein